MSGIREVQPSQPQPPQDQQAGGNSSTTANVGGLNQFDLPGLFGLIQKFSAATVLTGFAVALFLYQRSDNAAARADLREQHSLLRDALKEEGRQSREAAKEAHTQFLAEEKANREAVQRQWEVLRKSGENMQELQRSIADHQRTMATMVEEVKKIKIMHGGGGN